MKWVDGNSKTKKKKFLSGKLKRYSLIQTLGKNHSIVKINNHFEFQSCRLWAEIEAHKWRDLELNLSKTVEILSQDSQLIQANSKKKLRDNKKLLECSFAQI